MASHDSSQAVAELTARLAAAESRADALAAELETAKGREVATREVLRAVGQSGDLNAVLDALILTAAQLVGVDQMMIHLVVGDHLAALAASADPIRAEIREARAISTAHPILLPYSKKTISGRTILEHRTIVIEDLQAVWDEYSDVPLRFRDSITHSAVAVPLLRDSQAIGVLRASRLVVQPFTESEIALLESFAAQAAIAIENARLVAELNDSNANLRESLEQQTATSRVLEAISRSPTELQHVLDTISDSASRLCGTDRSLIALVRDDTVRMVAGLGTDGTKFTLIAPSNPLPLDRKHSFIAGAMADREVVHIHDLVEVPIEELLAPHARQLGVRTSLSVPMFGAGGVVGGIQLSRTVVQPFTDAQIALIQTFASQAVIAIENTRLFQKLNDSNASLRESLEQQTATSRVLEAISRSPTELQLVLDTIADSAGRLCETERVLIVLAKDGEDKALQSGEAEAVRDLHVDWCLELTRGAASEFIDMGAPDNLRVQLRTELENFRTALTWCAWGETGPGKGLEIVASMNLNWTTLGSSQSESRRWLETLLPLAPARTATRCAALDYLGHIFRWEHEFDLAGGASNESLAIALELGDDSLIANATAGAGLVAGNQGDYERAVSLLEDALALSRTVGNVTKITHHLRDLGVVALSAGYFARARVAFQESIELARLAGRPAQALAALSRMAIIARIDGDYSGAHAYLDESDRLTNEVHRVTVDLGRANLARAEGEYDEAHSQLVDALRRMRAVGEGVGIRDVMAMFGMLEIARGATARGVTIIAAAGVWHPGRPMGTIHVPDVRIDGPRHLEMAREALGQAAYDDAWATGQKLSLEDASQLILAEPEAKAKGTVAAT